MFLRYDLGYLSALYNSCVMHHFPESRRRIFNKDEKDLLALARFLRKEGLDPNKYFHFVFGVQDTVYPYPPSPKTLLDPLLVQKYRSMTYEPNSSFS